MDTLTNLLVKWTGLGKAWDFFNGKKAYVAGGGLILLGVAQIAVQVAAAQSPADIFHLVKEPPVEPVKLILQGLGLIGVRHAQAKSEPAQ